MKKLISLALVCGFLCVGLGCGDTATKKSGTSTTTTTTTSGTTTKPKTGDTP